MSRAVEELTMTMDAVTRGEVAALSKLHPLLEREIRAQATEALADGAAPGVLARDLVRSIEQKVVTDAHSLESRRQMVIAAAEVLRRAIVRHHRAHRSGLRQAPDWTALDGALEKLGGHDPRRRQIAVLHLFAGKDEAEIAQLLGEDVREVRREWGTAKLWLSAEVAAGRSSR